MKDLIEKTLREIKEQKITPGPRWKYLVRKYSTWLGFSLVVFLGAISFSIALEMLGQLDWDLYRFAHQSALGYSLTLLPYFWLVFIAIFLVLAFFDLRRTETGYRYGWFKLSLLAIGGIIVIGLLFSLIGFSEKVNKILIKDVPYYGQHLMMTKEKQWMQPVAGFLAGDIETVSSNELEISDLNGQKWKVLLNEQTLVRPAVKLMKGETIKVIGTKKEASKFKALEIRPWMGQGMMNNAGVGNGGGRNIMRGN